MKINDNGVIREMTAEEIKKMKDTIAKRPKPEPDKITALTEKVDKLGTDISEVLRLLRGGK